MDIQKKIKDNETKKGKQKREKDRLLKKGERKRQRRFKREKERARERNG